MCRLRLGFGVVNVRIGACGMRLGLFAKLGVHLAASIPLEPKALNPKPLDPQTLNP